MKSEKARLKSVNGLLSRVWEEIVPTWLTNEEWAELAQIRAKLLAREKRSSPPRRKRK